jgi:hypothetical protein
MLDARYWILDAGCWMLEKVFMGIKKSPNGDQKTNI